MKEHVTVIPADGIIICDGIALSCAFTAHAENLHALQWHKGRGHIEYRTGGLMSNEAIASYEAEVAPYVERWQAEYDALNSAPAALSGDAAEGTAAAQEAVPDRLPLSAKTGGETTGSRPEKPAAAAVFSGTAPDGQGDAASAPGLDAPAEASVCRLVPDRATSGATGLPGVGGPLPFSRSAGRRIAESRHDGKNWYCLWPDGWLEQGGEAAIGPRGTVLIAFPQAFGTLRHIGITPCGFSGERNHAASIGLAAQSTVGFTACQCSDRKSCHWNGFLWYACGESA